MILKITTSSANLLIVLATLISVSLIVPTNSQAHGGYCDNNQPCHENYTCINHICECPLLSHQIYDSTLNECLSLVKGSCVETVNNVVFRFNCSSENADCRNSPITHFPECLCKTGFIESKERDCKLTHDSACDVSGDCDEFSGLECRDGKCLCHEYQEYDVEEQMCKGLVGAICDPQIRGFCTNSASCISFRDESIGKGVCECDVNTEANAFRKCVRR